jgi:hypothetical protein
MKVRDPGHVFIIENYPAKEERYPILPEDARESAIQFRKRVGPGYPGNGPYSYDGTTTQELLRVIISRAKYVDNQEHDPANDKVIEFARNSILALEARAAERRGEEYLSTWNEDITTWMNEDCEVEVEDAKTCLICGHIFCRKHTENPKL